MNPQPPRRERRSVAVSVAIYRLLLRAYPAAFRRRYGAAILQVFRDTCRQTSEASGLAGLLAFWLPTLGDLVKNASAERLLSTRHLSRSSIIRLCGLLALIGAVLSFPLTLLQWWMSTVLNSPAFITAHCQFGCSLTFQNVSSLGALAVSVLQPLVALCLPFGLLGILLLQQSRRARCLAGLALLAQIGIAGAPAPGGSSYAASLGAWLAQSPGVLPYAMFHLLRLVGLLAWFGLPITVFLCGMLILKTRLLGTWSVVLLLLGGAIALQLFLPVSITLLFNSSYSILSSVLVINSVLAIAESVLWAVLGYALWARKAALLIQPEPLDL